MPASRVKLRERAPGVVAADIADHAAWLVHLVVDMLGRELQAFAIHDDAVTCGIGLGAQFGLPMDKSGFIIADEAKAMFSAGCAKKAADVVTSTQNSTAAALKAIQASR